SWNLARGASILRGTVVTRDDARLIADSNSGALLNGITLGGTLDLTNPHASVTVVNGLTLTDSTVLIGDPSTSGNGEFFFSGTQTLDGRGTIVFSGHTFNLMRVLQADATLTLGSGILIHGENGTLDGTIINQGIISDDDPGGTLHLTGRWTNNGTIQASN